jgi:hypothetical protein
MPGSALQLTTPNEHKLTPSVMWGDGFHGTLHAIVRALRVGEGTSTMVTWTYSQQAQEMMAIAISTHTRISATPTAHTTHTYT